MAFLLGNVLCCPSLQAGDEQPKVATAPTIRTELPREPVSFEPRSIDLIYAPALVTGVAISPDGKLLAVARGIQDTTGELVVWSLADRTKRFETRRQFGIRALAMSPDGKLIATGDFDRIARLYEAAAGKLVAELAGHTGVVRSVAFSPDGKRLITGGLEGKVLVWSVDSGKRLTTLLGHKREVYSVAISGDGRTIASGGHDQTVRLWDAGSGEAKRVLSGHNSKVGMVAFSPDGKTLASADWSGAVKLWDVSSGEPKRTLSAADSGIYGLAFAPDGEILAAGLSSGRVQVWNTATGEPYATVEAREPDAGRRAGGIYGLAFLPDGKRLAIGHSDGATTIWDVAAERETAVFQTEPDPNDKPSPVLAVAYAPDGKRIVSLHADRSVRFRDSQTGALQELLKGQDAEIACLALSPDGKLLATAGTDKVVTVWDIGMSRPKPAAGPGADVASRASRRNVFAGHTSSIFSLAFSRDGRWLASGSHDQTARLWSVADGSAKATLAGHTGIVRSVAFSPDGRRLATGGSDHTVRLWDAETAKAVATFDGHTDTVCAVAFSPDGATLASGSQDRTVKLWDVGPGGASKRPGDAPLRATLEGHAGAVWCLAFSPQGKTLASGGLDKVCRLWNPQNRVTRAAPSFDSAVISLAFAPDASALVIGTYGGLLPLRRARIIDAPWFEPLATIPGPPDTLMTVAISPDGRLLASAGKDRQVTLRSLPSCEPVRKLGDHSNGICHLAFSPDGKTLGVCLYDGQVVLWDAQAGQKVRSLSAHAKGTRRVNFSPDGARITTAGWDQTAKLWSVTTGQLLHTTPAQPIPVSEVAFSPDGRTFATTTGNWRDSRTPGEVKLWDAETGRELAKVGDHALEIKGLMFDPRGGQLFSYGPQGVRVWDVASRELRAILAEGTAVTAAVLLPEGNHLVIGDNQGGIAVWHVATGKPVLQYRGHEDMVFHLACSPDGSLLASVSRDGSLTLWPVRLESR
jgi:WD40 repeat protein